MSLWASLFGTKTRESVALVDIAADSVGGAYVIFEAGQMPAIIYTKRVVLSARPKELPDQSLARGLAELSERMIREGVPVLARSVGSGSVHRLVASIAEPWQDSAVTTEQIEKPAAFTFTHAMLTAAVNHASEEPENRVLLDESVVATMLNGYPTTKPYGRSATRASVVILAAHAARTTTEVIAAALRRLHHSHRISLEASDAVYHHAFAALFPHEEEFILFHSRGPVGSLLIVRKHMPIAIARVEQGSDTLAALLSSLSELAKAYPLPRTLFLITEEAMRSSLMSIVTDQRFASLWLSVEPPRVVALIPEHLAGRVKNLGTLDLFLSLMALAYTQKEEA